MSTGTFAKVDYPLSNLIQQIEFGEIGLPDIQRPFVWSTQQVRDLFDSMYKGFPVGYLLFWVNSQSNGERQIGDEPKQTRVPRLLIVDGQQRLTSLFAVLKGVPVYTEDYEYRNIQIAFNPLRASFEVADAAIVRSAEYIPDISKLWTEQHTSYRAINAYLTRLRAARPAIQPVTDDEEHRASEAIDKLFDLQNYSFTAMQISPTVGEEQVAEIFVRINSKGVQLRQADFILTLLSVFWDEGRSDLETFSRLSRKPAADKRSSPYNHFIQPDPDQLLRSAIAVGFKRARLEHVYSLLRGKDLDTGEFSDERREQQFSVLRSVQAHVLNLDNWHDFFKTLLLAGYRSSSMITSQIGLVYTYAMYLIGRHEFCVPNATLRRVIARWFFMVSTTSRYTGSFETIMEADLARLRTVGDVNGFVATLDQVVEDVLTNDFWKITFPNSLETSTARSPFIFAYYAALSLLDARVLFSPLKVSQLLDPALKGNRSSLERHHLFPKAYLKRHGYEDIRTVNQAANFALVEWGDNAKITDQPPSYYFPKYAERFSKKEMQDMMWWHSLPDRWYDMDYQTFLAERRRLMAEITRQGFFTLLGQG